MPATTVLEPPRPASRLRRRTQGLFVLLRKLRREIGFNGFRLLWGLATVLYNSHRPTPRNIRRALKNDRATLQKRAAEDLLAQARFYEAAPAPGEALRRFEGLAERHGPDGWRGAARDLAHLATLSWDGIDDPAPYLAFLAEQDDAYFRHHYLNKGKNDYWEYYLVPWHRTYGDLTVALLDPRLRPHLLPVWQRYDRWFREERPWMTRFIVGSNVASVLAGYTFHALLGFLIHEDPRERKRYLRDYARYARRLHRALRSSFDVSREPAVPFEGVLYGAFWFITAILLGCVQRALGLSHCLLDASQLATLPAYIWKSRTPDGDYQTSGDSKPYEGAVPVPEFFLMLREVQPDAFTRRLADLSPAPHYLTGKVNL